MLAREDAGDPFGPEGLQVVPRGRCEGDPGVCEPAVHEVRQGTTLILPEALRGPGDVGGAMDHRNGAEGCP